MKGEMIEVVPNEIEKKEKENRVAKRLVEIEFNNGVCLSYLTDIQEIEVGDLVTVEGKLEDKVGVVKMVRKSFKVPKLDMKWVDSVLDREISGDYFKMGGDVVSLNSVLTAEKFITMYAGLRYQENQALGEEEMDVDVATFEENELFDNPLVKDRGKELFKEGSVAFLSLQEGRGKAIVRGGDWYEIDFRYKEGRITYMVCDCPYFGECKHEIAVLYKLREVLGKMTKKRNLENFVLCGKDFFTEMLLLGAGKVVLEL